MCSLLAQLFDEYEKAKDHSSLDEFAKRRICGNDHSGMDANYARSLLSDALSIPDQPLARDWAHQWMTYSEDGQARQELLRWLVAQANDSISRARNTSALLKQAEEQGPPEDIRLCEAVLYWKSGSDATFAENRTYKQQFHADGRIKAVVMTLEPQEAGYTGLRFDIANRVGIYAISRLMLLDSHGSLLWQWHYQATNLKNIRDVELVCPPENSPYHEACMVANGNDPQFELCIGNDILDILSGDGGEFRVVFRAFA